MKKLSIKLKITLWFTVFMFLLSALVFSFIIFLSGTTTTHETRGALTGLIDDNLGEIEYDDGVLEIDDDFESFRNGVYCLVFYGSGGKVSGYAPYEELESLIFEDSVIRPVTIGADTYLVYDRLFSVAGHEDAWIRGLVLESGSSIASWAVYRAVLIAIPLLIVLAAVGGYQIARSSLRPIQRISETAEEIGSSGDLSKRIEMESNGDELNRLAGTFNRMFQRLETNFEAERSFTADASHELRTPVTTILAQCEYAFENASGEQELYEAIGAIQKQGYRMSHIIESLLYFTRIEQRTEAPAFETVSLSSIVASVCRERKALGEKGISFTEDIQPNISVKGDIALLSRMLENLIGNAYRYGRENGEIHVALKEEGHEAVISVADNGIGIADEEIPKIWNRFYRADKSRSSARGAGLGLGLALVKQIAQLHGSRVQVESKLGQGSVFSVAIPVK